MARKLSYLLNDRKELARLAIVECRKAVCRRKENVTLQLFPHLTGCSDRGRVNVSINDGAFGLCYAYTA